jgi:hypothetical protein
MDLLIAYGFDFEKGTWFEFLGYLEKLLNEDNALSKRIGYRTYKKPSSGKSAAKQQENEQHSHYNSLKSKYRLSSNEKERKQNMQNTFNTLKEIAKKK